MGEEDREDPLAALLSREEAVVLEGKTKLRSVYICNRLTCMLYVVMVYKSHLELESLSICTSLSLSLVSSLSHGGGTEVVR